VSLRPLPAPPPAVLTGPASSLGTRQNRTRTQGSDGRDTPTAWTGASDNSGCSGLMRGSIQQEPKRKPRGSSTPQVGRPRGDRRKGSGGLVPTIQQLVRKAAGTRLSRTTLLPSREAPAARWCAPASTPPPRRSRTRLCARWRGREAVLGHRGHATSRVGHNLQEHPSVLDARGRVKTFGASGTRSFPWLARHPGRQEPQAGPQPLRRKKEKS